MSLSYVYAFVLGSADVANAIATSVGSECFYRDRLAWLRSVNGEPGKGLDEMALRASMNSPFAIRSTERASQIMKPPPPHNSKTKRQ